MDKIEQIVASKQYEKIISFASKTESANSGNQFYDINTKYCQPSNLIPHFWFYKIVDKQGNPDLTCIMILSEILGWFRCLAKPHIYDSTNQSLPELVNGKLAISYDFLANKLNLQKERIRRKLVTLETLGFVSREIKNIAMEDGSRINQLFISIDQEFFQSCFRSPEQDIRVGNDEFIETGNTDFEPSPLLGGDHISNKNKNRSIKSNFNLNDSEENSLETIQAKATEEQVATKKLAAEESRASRAEKQEPKKLKDFYPLTEEDCSLLQSKSGRSFSLKAMNEILQDMSKKLLTPEFWSKKGFLAYMSKAFTYEMRDELKVSNISFKIRNNYTEVDKQEKFLSEIESCLQVTQEWHLKKKLAAVLERSTAYNFLLNYQYSERVGDVYKFYLANEVSIGAMDRQIILNQVKATQERAGLNGKIEYIENVEFIFENKWKPDHGKANSTNKETDYLAEIAKEAERQKALVWLEVRKSFIAGSYTEEEGIALDKSWLSKLAAVEEGKKIILDSSSELIKDWIRSKYLIKLEKITKELGYEIELVGY